MNKSKNNYGKSDKSLMVESSYWAMILMNNAEKTHICRGDVYTECSRWLMTNVFQIMRDIM